jgi:hypothetical protein
VALSALTGEGSLTALASLIASATALAGFTDAYTSGTQKGWTTVNVVTNGGGADQQFAVLTKVDVGASTVGLCLAKNITAGVVSGQLASFVEITGLVGPFDFFVVCTPFRLVINIFDHGQTKYFTLFAACVDHRVVDQGVTGAGSNATHLQNLKNNSQVVGKLGTPASFRILYAGTPSSNNVYDQPVELEVVSIFDDIASIQHVIPVSLTVANVAPNQLHGFIHGLCLSDTRMLFNLDRGVDGSGSYWRMFKDTNTSTGLFVKED